MTTTTDRERLLDSIAEYAERISATWAKEGLHMSKDKPNDTPVKHPYPTKPIKPPPDPKGK